MYSSSGISSSDSGEDEVASSPPKKKKIVKFTSAQRFCLNQYWSRGLTGCGKKYSPVIIKAARDTGLTCDQVKVYFIYYNLAVFMWLLLKKLLNLLQLRDFASTSIGREG